MLSHSVFPVDSRYRIWPCNIMSAPGLCASWKITNKICDFTVPLELLARKPPGFGPGVRVSDTASTSENGPV